MFDNRYAGDSLHLPILNLKSGDGDGECPLEEVLLDHFAYIVDERNHTTATSKTRDGKDLQVTFFLAPPPCVSYFCCVCTENVHKFVSEPLIIATEGNFALIVLTHRPPYNLMNRKKDDYYVYRAPVRDGGWPTLRLLRHPDPDLFLHNRSFYFHDSAVGLLRYRINRDEITTLHGHHKRDEYDYMVATLYARDAEPDQYDLYTYDSTTQDWARKSTTLSEPDRRQLLGHRCDKVITVGADAGTMGWVDLGRGIILCDLLQEETSPRRLRYMTLPDPIQQDNKLGGTSNSFRNIACVQGRIKLVELQMDIWRPGSRRDGPYVQTGWTAVQWSRTADDCSDWFVDMELSASAIIIPADIGEMLPRLPNHSGEGTVLERLHVGYPTLSLLPGDDVVYFMAKVDIHEHDSWLISLDMKKKTLVGVTQFAAQRGINTYRHTTISKYLTTALGTKHNMKRPGVPLSGSSGKKLPPNSYRYDAQQVEGTDEYGPRIIRA